MKNQKKTNAKKMRKKNENMEIEIQAPLINLTKIQRRLKKERKETKKKMKQN